MSRDGARQRSFAVETGEIAVVKRETEDPLQPADLGDRQIDDALCLLARTEGEGDRRAGAQGDPFPRKHGRVRPSAPAQQRQSRAGQPGGGSEDRDRAAPRQCGPIGRFREPHAISPLFRRLRSRNEPPARHSAGCGAPSLAPPACASAQAADIDRHRGIRPGNPGNRSTLLRRCARRDRSRGIHRNARKHGTRPSERPRACRIPGAGAETEPR